MDALMENLDIRLEADKLLFDKRPMSPKKKITVRAVISGLSQKNATLEEENADLKQQLANLKKLVYGQKSEKTEIIL